MVSQSVKFTLLFVIASVLLFAGFLLSWYPHSVIESMETRLNQGGLTQSELDQFEGSLTWWQAQGIFYYGSASNFVIASGILVLVYTIVYSVLFTLQESIRAKKGYIKRQEISQIKFEENEIDNFQFEETQKTERISPTIAGGLLTIIASCIILVFSGVLVVDSILVESSQASASAVNTLADGAFGILVSGFALTGGILILIKKKITFVIISMCFMIVKSATFVTSTGNDFWGLFIGIDVFTLTIVSLMFTLIAYKEFS